MKRVLTALAATLPFAANAADAISGAVERQPTNWQAIIMFLIFVVFTLGITYWASKRVRSRSDYYTAGGNITGFQNGLAIAGDYMSAASFLGISALVFTSGYDGLIYSLGFLVGWPIILFLIAERLRNLGRYTFADVASYRLKQGPIRILSACGSLVVVALYLIAQMVGAGKLIELLFGLNYHIAVVLVGVLMMMYVLFGGMLATTWVQIIKAVLLLFGASFMAFMVMKHVGFSFNNLFSEAMAVHPKGVDIMKPGGLVKDPVSALSLGLGLMFGTAGLPHILMRFFTVSDAREARKSVFYATGFMGYFYILTFIIGFGAIMLVGANPEYKDAAGHLIGGNNMAAVHLANAVGGNLFLGFISAVAFATILAVVAGLTLAGASAVSHDLYANVFKKGATEREELRVSKITVLILGVIAIILGVLMMMYVLFGGMLATTWVQIIKAVLLLFGASFMAFMVMKHVGFSFNNLFSEAMAVHPKGVDIMKPGGLVKDPISALSLGLGLMFGTAGLPHILMRFFTVSDAREARKSVFYATGFMGYFYILTFIIGFGAIMLVGANPEYKDAAGHLIGGNNMAAVHLANAVGGNLFLGFISAVAFATILAVVAGLTLAGASAVSHDLYANVFKKGATEREELRVSKITVLILGVIAIILGVLFENQNIAFMVGLAFAIAASCNFPIILLSMYWSKLTTRGAMMGGWLGLITAVVLMILGPTIWVQILGHEKAIFPYEYPALFSITVAFLGIWFFSATDNSAEGARERELFRAQFIRSQTGFGVEQGRAH